MSLITVDKNEKKYFYPFSGCTIAYGKDATNNPFDHISWHTFHLLSLAGLNSWFCFYLNLEPQLLSKYRSDRGFCLHVYVAGLSVADTCILIIIGHFIQRGCLRIWVCRPRSWVGMTTNRRRVTVYYPTKNALLVQRARFGLLYLKVSFLDSDRLNTSSSLAFSVL